MIGAGAADEIVIAETAPEQVVSGAAVQGVGIGIARQGVVEGRPDDVLHILQGIVSGPTTGILAAEVDNDPRCRRGVIGGVNSPVADQFIRPARAVENVVARASEQGVCSPVAGEAVGEVGAVHALDRGECVGPVAAA